jgi:hypothetical protein
VAPGLACADEPKPVGAVAAVAGKGTITHAAKTESAAVKVEDSVFVRDKLATAESSIIRVLMGGRITITIRERSVVTITDDPARTRVDLESGLLALKVHDGALRPGEIVELRTPNAITGIRGSLVVANVSGSDSHVTVVEARHQVTIAPRQAPAQTTPVPVGHTVRVSGPPHAARVNAVTKAAKDHLEKAAATAEVPGRPKDGGQERSVHFDPKIGRLVPAVTKATAAPAAEGKVLVAPEGKAVLAPAGKAVLAPEGKAVLQPETKVLSPARVAPVITPPPAAQAPAVTKAPAQLKKVEEPESAVTQSPAASKRLLAPR